MSQMEGAGPAETGDLPGRNGDGNLAVAALRVPAGGMPEDAWAYDDFGTEEEGASAGLASGPLLGPALRRGAWLWCLTAVMGLLAGLAFTLVLPPAPQASTTVLVAHNPNENPADAIVTDVALAQSRTVAVDAMRRLGLPQIPKSITKFQGSYTLSMVTDRLILFTVKAPTTSQAVLRARVLANDFLQLRAHQLQSEQQLTVAAIDQQIAQGKKQIA